MKRLLTLTFGVVSALGSLAQTASLDNSENRPYLGARLSIDASIPTDVKFAVGNGSYKSGLYGTGGGVSIGAVYNIPVVANLFVEPGLDLYYHTNSINVGNAIGDDQDNKDFRNRSLRKFGMRIPIQIGYRYDFDSNMSASVFTGPVLDVGFSNDYYLTTREIDGVKFHNSGSMYDTMHRVNFSWRFGVGISFLKNYYVGLSGDIGMVNMLKNEIEGMKVSMHENNFQLTLGYNF